MKNPNFNDVIHYERTRLLGLLPKNVSVFCSAGCSGSWYFNWIEEAYGPVNRHIGIELYSPEPDDLPSNVDWIRNSVSNMVDISSGSVDLLFSGQNIEHLYPSDLKGFLSEANRVVRDGGTLCVDSPNRSITQSGGYVQPEHVLELTANEAVKLIQLAGFSVDAVYGIWCCEDEAFQRLEIQSMGDPGQLRDRLTAAMNTPKDSFIWWIVATKVGGPDPNLHNEVDALFLKEFPGFVRSRFSLATGILKNACGTEVLVEVKHDQSGYVFYGPYVPLAPGKYLAEFLVKPIESGGRIRFDVVSGNGADTHAISELALDRGRVWQSVGLIFSLDKYTTGIETRAFSEAANAVLRFGSQIIPLE